MSETWLPPCPWYDGVGADLFPHAVPQRQPVFSVHRGVARYEPHPASVAPQSVLRTADGKRVLREVIPAPR